MKKIEEQLESIEEVLTHLVKKISGIEETIEKMAADNTTRNLLADLKSSLTKMPSGQQFQAQMSGIQTSIDNLPKQSQVKHHHHFDLRSRGFIISAAILLIVSAISVGIAVTNSGENSRLHAMDVKYRMVRQFNPEIVAWIDSIYYQNPELAEQETEKREAHELVVNDAEALLKQKQQETKNAQNLLKKLKKD
jgi:regulator of replication initiation timing